MKAREGNERKRKLAKQPSKEREPSKDDWKVDQTSGSESESEGTGNSEGSEAEVGTHSEAELSASEAKSDSGES